VVSSDVTEVSSCSLEYALHQRVADVLQDVEQSLIRRLSETSIVDVRGA